MDAISTGIFKIIIEDGGSHSTSRAGNSPPGGSFNPNASSPASPSAKSDRPAPPTVPVSNPIASIEDKVRSILADKSAVKRYGLDAENLGKMPANFIDDLYAKMGAPKEPVKSPAMDPVQDGRELRELQNISGHLADIRRAGRGMKAPVEPVPKPPEIYGFADDRESGAVYGLQAPESRGKSAAEQVMEAAGKAADKQAAQKAEDAKKPYGFKDAKDRVEAGDTYKVEPAVDRPNLPQGRPVEPRPVGQVVSDAEKSREQWTLAGAGKDLAGWLPGGIGQTLTKKWESMSGAYKAASGEAAAAGAGRAGATAAGVGEAALAAGPAAALLAVEVAATLSAKAHNSAAKAIEGLGNQTARLAGNDHMGLFNAAVDGAKETLNEIPIVGKKWAAELNMATAPVRAFTTAVGAFVERGKELSAYSGPLARATTQADIRTMFGDIRESERLGESLARLTEAQSRADDTIRNELIPIKQFLITKLAAAVEAGLATWETVKPILETIGNTISDLLGLIEEISKNLPFGLMKQAIENYLKEKRLAKPIPPPNNAGTIHEWLDAVNDLPLNFGGGIGRRDEKQPGPVFPGFGNQLGM